MTVLDAALRYLDRGWSVIPIDWKTDVEHAKKPLLHWKEFQDRHPSHNEIQSWWKKWPKALIGGITGKISGRLVIDVDSKEALVTLQEKYLPEIHEVPIVSTPRGGKHFHYTYVDGIGSKNGIIEKIDVKCDGGYVILPPSANERGTYTWLISEDDGELIAPPEQMLSLLKNAFILSGKIKDGASELLHGLQDVTNVTLNFTEGNRDESLFHVALSLLKGGMTPDNALLCLKNLASQCKPPFPEKELSRKIESAIRRLEARDRNISGEVKGWALVTSGYFNVTTCYNELQLLHKEEKTCARVALHRLVESGLLERSPEKNGYYRRVENDCPDIDFINVDNDIEPILLPFNLHLMVEIMPGNVIIVAGEPDAGKTAFLLNIVRMNMHQYDTWYFSSEMGNKELHTRLSKFKGTRMNEWKFHAKERAANFSDVIKPGRGNLNIIDFLEIYKDFYEVGGLIAEVHKKLDGALAIIALQKNRESEVGLGGYRSLEKARLYLNMTRENKIEIVKAKNWKDPSKNPNRLVLEYRVHGGANLEARKDWYKP